MAYRCMSWALLLLSAATRGFWRFAVLRLPVRYATTEFGDLRPVFSICRSYCSEPVYTVANDLVSHRLSTRRSVSLSVPSRNAP